MRYRVIFQAVADASAMVYVEADSLEEASEKAEKLNRDDISWDIDGVDEDTIEVSSVREKPRPTLALPPTSGGEQ